MFLLVHVELVGALLLYCSLMRMSRGGRLERTSRWGVGGYKRQWGRFCCRLLQLMRPVCLASLVLSYLEVKEAQNVCHIQQLRWNRPTKGNEVKTEYRGPSFKIQVRGPHKGRRRSVCSLWSEAEERSGLSSSLGFCVDHMGKQDGAVTSILCLADLDAWVCNGSITRNILTF